MKLNELRARRALAARQALAGGLGALRSFRAPIAKMLLEWRAQQKKMNEALKRYEKTLEEDPDYLGKPDLQATSRLLEALKTGLKDETEDLSTVWVELVDHEAAFRKRKVKLTRLEKKERAEARKAARLAKKAGAK